MNKLTTAKRVSVIAALVEGNSINSTVRMTGVSKPTILKLLAELGKVCADYHDEHVTGLTCSRLQLDEIWSFCYAKKKNVPEELRGQYGYGDVWTWTAIDADTKMIVSYYAGLREDEDANTFTADLRSRVVNSPQLTSDGHTNYRSAVANAFGANVDFAQLEKQYGVMDHGKRADQRYSPAMCIGAVKTVRSGNPDLAYVSTSYNERQNLTMRMSMRRFTRLTNGCSKKIQNHEAAISLYFLYYNFCRIHSTLRVTPAMEAGLSDRLWEIEDIVALLD